ncbi:MAG: hypothetical protein QM831_37275 [Kofleriaceae bacterium]
MAKKLSTVRDEEREVSRRALIKWSLAAGAALGVGRGKIVEILEKTAGKRTAEAAATSTTKRSVHIRAGTGGLAWWQLMWPHNDVAAAKNTAFAWPQQFFSGTQTKVLTGVGGQKLTTGPNSAFASLDATKQWTAVMGGSNEQHTQTPISIARSVSAGSMFAIASVLQNEVASVVPVITVDNQDFGTAPGAGQPSIVPTADDIVGLFNSVASRSNHLLANSVHADLYRAQYQTLASLNRASTLSTTKTAYHTARSAATFLGTNLAAQLQLSAADLTAYGLDSTEFNAISGNSGNGLQKDMVMTFGKTLAVTAKAFALGLTSSVVVPAMSDDPHGAFGSGGMLTNNSLNVLVSLQRIMDGFMADLATKTDKVTTEKLSDNIVITIEGDTPKTPVDNNTWPDTTASNSNWGYIYSGGSLKSGWFGGIDRNNNAKGFDPGTGAVATLDNDKGAKALVTAAAYAIAKGDKRRVGDFSTLNIDGMINTSGGQS